MLLPHLKKLIQISAQNVSSVANGLLVQALGNPQGNFTCKFRFLPECKSQTQTRCNGLLLLRTTIIIRTTTAKA